MKHFHALSIIIFQTDNPMSAKRLADYLGRNQWLRFSKGVYHSLHPVNDKESFCEKILKEYLISHDDFFAIIDAKETSIPTDVFYNRKAPNWPTDI